MKQFWISSLLAVIAAVGLILTMPKPKEGQPVCDDFDYQMGYCRVEYDGSFFPSMLALFVPMGIGAYLSLREQSKLFEEERQHSAPKDFGPKSEGNLVNLHQHRVEAFLKRSQQRMKKRR